MRFPFPMVVLSLAALLSACGTQLRVADVDERTGLLKSERGEVTEATVIASKGASLATFEGTVFVSNGGEYGVNQMKATKLFATVLEYDDLQRIVVANGLQDKVPSVGEPIGLSRLAKAYKPFLWVSFSRTARDNGLYLQMVAVNADSLEQLFAAEVPLDFMWKGVRDQNSRYPLFNAFIEWARRNP